MKIALPFVLCAASALAQSPSQGQYASPSAACGVESASFKTKMDDTRHDLDKPAPGKALVYFIHDSGTPQSFAYPTTKIGLDSKWVGANHSNSYFSVSVDPGEHHLCATLQSSFALNRVELAHFQAEAGKVYFYRTRLILSGSVELLELEPLDSDQGHYLVAQFPFSVSTRK